MSKPSSAELLIERNGKPVPIRFRAPGFEFYAATRNDVATGKLDRYGNPAPMEIATITCSLCGEELARLWSCAPAYTSVERILRTSVGDFVTRHQFQPGVVDRCGSSKRRATICEAGRLQRELRARGWKNPGEWDNTLRRAGVIDTRKTRARSGRKGMEIGAQEWCPRWAFSLAALGKKIQIGEREIVERVKTGDRRIVSTVHGIGGKPIPRTEWQPVYGERKQMRPIYRVPVGAPERIRLIRAIAFGSKTERDDAIDVAGALFHDPVDFARFVDDVRSWSIPWEGWPDAPDPSGASAIPSNQLALGSFAAAAVRAASRR